MGFALKPSCWNKWHSVATAARSMSCTKTQTTSGTNSASDQLYGHSFDPTALTEEHWLLIMRRRGLWKEEGVHKLPGTSILSTSILSSWPLSSNSQAGTGGTACYSTRVELFGCNQPPKKDIAYQGCLSFTYASLNPCLLFLRVNASNSFASQHPPLLPIS